MGSGLFGFNLGIWRRRQLVSASHVIFYHIGMRTATALLGAPDTVLADFGAPDREFSGVLELQF